MLWRLYEYLGTSIFLDLLLQGFKSSPPVRQGRVHTPQYPLIVHGEEVEHLVSLGLLDLMIGLTFLLLVLVETVADNQQAEWRPLIGPDPSRYCAIIGCYASSLTS